MKPIKNKDEIKRLQAMIAEMTIDDEGYGYGCDFNPEWMRTHGLKVVPFESGARIIPEEIAVIVPALRKAGYRECFAVATEPVAPRPSCYHMSITVDDFNDFNAQCGFLRYALVDEKQSWSISCYEDYNLFAAEPALLEAMLGKSIEHARQEYLEYAVPLAEFWKDDRLVKIVQLYAEL